MRKNYKTIAVGTYLLIIFTFSVMGDEVVSTSEQRIPTHADAAIIFAKHTGLFDKYISKDASLSECVSFLNKTGIYFGLKEVVRGNEFTAADCARVMGQIELVFEGEAELVGGKVMLPKNIDTWEDFCIMYQVNYVEGYQAIKKALFFCIDSV